MSARSTRGPGGGRTGGRRPAARKGGGRGAASSGCLTMVVAVGLVLGMSLLLTPLATRVWTAEIVPAANRLHYGDGLVVAILLAGLLLYVLVSVLFVRRRTYSPAGSVPVLRGAGTSSRSGVSVLDVARGEPRSEDTAAGVPTSPGPTPAATSSQPVASGLGLTAAEATRASASAVMTAVAVPRGATADGSGAFYLSPSSAPSGGGRAAGRCVTPGGAA